MQKLKRIQSAFYQTVFQGGEGELSFISSNYPAERFNVYRQNIFENLCAALHLVFPGVWKLLGEDCANSVAYAFCKAEGNLPTSGYLDDWGGDFPEFLERQKELSTLPYLNDYARYEWLKHRSYIAGQGDVMSLMELKEEMKLAFIPSLFLFTSRFPIQAIQGVVDNPESEPIKLNAMGVWGIVARSANVVVTFWIAESLWSFISFIEQGLSLELALEKVQKKDVGFDVVGAVNFLFDKGLVCHCPSN